MAKISKQDIEHVARLARLELNETEKDKFTPEIGAVLNYVEELNQTATLDVAVVGQTCLPARQVSGLSDIARPDEITNTNNRDNMLQNAPATQDGLIKVKKVFD